jgi:hypothetical protein
MDQYWDLLPGSIARPVDRATALDLTSRCFSFAVVRNPFDRILSAYNNKVIEIPVCPGRMRAIGIRSGMPLAGFLERVCAARSEDLDIHVLPQVEILCVAGTPVPTWVAYAENLSAHWTFLVRKARRAGISGLPRHLPTKNSRRQGDTADLRTLLADPSLVALVRQRYQDDLSIFYPWLLEGELSVEQVRLGGPRRPRHFFGATEAPRRAA